MAPIPTDIRLSHPTPIFVKITAMNNNTALTAAALLQQWQGHRALTRRVIEAFPEKELFDFSVGGMRPFAQLAKEMIGMTFPGIKGVATNDWSITDGPEYDELPDTKAELLQRWDAVTARINDFWTRIPEGRFQERTLAFERYEGSVHGILFYIIDNEIHHRGQGYVYLRALGIEPPPFWERPMG